MATWLRVFSRGIDKVTTACTHARTGSNAADDGHCIDKTGYCRSIAMALCFLTAVANLTCTARSAGTEAGTTGTVADSQPGVTDGGQPRDETSAKADPQPEAAKAPVATGETKPESMVPVKKVDQPARAAQIAANLTGHDRHLVKNPLSQIPAADYAIGPLAAGSIDPTLRATLDALARALSGQTLPWERMNASIVEPLRIIYGESLAEAPDGVRFAMPVRQADGLVLVRFRLFGTVRQRAAGAREVAAPETAPRGIRSATGFVILAPGKSDDGAVWQIYHLDLGADELARPFIRESGWDPVAGMMEWQTR